MNDKIVLSYHLPTQIHSNDFCQKNESMFTQSNRNDYIIILVEMNDKKFLFGDDCWLVEKMEQKNQINNINQNHQNMERNKNKINF